MLKGIFHMIRIVKSLKYFFLNKAISPLVIFCITLFFSISSGQDSIKVAVDSSSLKLPSTTGYSSIIFHSGKYIMGGVDGIVFSDDFQNWQEAKIASKRKYCTRDIVYFKDNFIAVGFAYTTMGGMKNCIALQSKDGAEWTEVFINKRKAMKGMGGKSGYGLWGIAANDSVVITCGAKGYIYYSKDGTNWTRAKFEDNSIAPYFDACWTGKRFVAVGAYGRIVISDDGINWKMVDNFSEEHLYGITNSENGCIAVGWGGTILFSKDGTKWEETTFSSNDDTKHDKINGVVWNNGKFVAVGYKAIVKPLNMLNNMQIGRWCSPATFLYGPEAVFYTSDDGKKWTKAKNDKNLPRGFQAVTWDGKQYVATSNCFFASLIARSMYDKKSLFTSVDGVTWSIE
jgi:photosystem II stability/assembly factor-like uncharacterized protein